MSDQPTVTPTLTIDQALINRPLGPTTKPRKRQHPRGSSRLDSGWPRYTDSLWGLGSGLTPSNSSRRRGPAPTLLADYRHFHRASKAMRGYHVADLRQRAS